jgi:glyoxylase-like metal-dependent hydrolase (beta-lactamase superfamily II)
MASWPDPSPCSAASPNRRRRRCWRRPGLRAKIPPPRRTAVNAFLIRHGDRVALVDTGSADSMGPTLGKLPENLAAAGVDPAAIDTVLLTHMHPDHSNGLAHPNGDAAFPNAELVLHAAEHAHWHDDAAMARAEPRARESGFLAARAQAAPYRGRMRLFTGGEVFPGVTAVPLPGHTPGHCGFRIDSGGESLLIWGDIVHIPEVQVPRPEATMVYDLDQAQAAATRRAVFEMVAAEALVVAGMHMHFPGLLRLGRHRDGYVLLPEAWRAVL